MADHEIKVVVTAVDQVSGKAKAMHAELKKVGNTKVNNNATKAIEQGADSATAKVKNLNREMEKTGSISSKVGGLMAKAFAIGSIAAFGKSCLTASANVEVLKKGLNFQIGQSETEKLIANMQQIGEQSAYDSSELIPLARQWITLGNNADDAISKMQMIVDVGSAFGLTQEQIGAANLALTQMASAGKIGAQDMMQLTNAGIPAWKMLADAMGLTVAEIRDMSQKGDLGQEAIDQLYTAFVDKTKGASASLADTTMASFSNLQETVGNTMSSIGDIMIKAFDVKGVLGDMGNFAEEFKGHINNIKKAMQDVGVRDAITNELNEVSPAAARVFTVLTDGFSSIKKFVTENSTAIKLLAEALITAGGTALAIMKIQAAFKACTAAVNIFRVACAAHPILLAISLIVTALVLVATHWDEIKSACQNAYDYISSNVSAAVAPIKTAFQTAADTVKKIWQEVVNLVTHPIDAVINVAKHVTESVTRSITEGGQTKAAKGGVFGGNVPMLANGGQARKGTPAIIGEAGPEAVVPLRANILQQIGESIAEATARGKASKGSRTAEILAKIRSSVDMGPIDAYSKALQDARQKAQSIGEALAEVEEMQKSANEEAAKYADTGEETLKYQNQISKLAEDDANRANITAKYEEEKAQALKTAQEIADQKLQIEKASSEALAQLGIQTAEKVYSRSTALEAAQDAQRKAMQATSYADFIAQMEAKNEITNESYGAILAQEQQLQEQRRAWYEEYMTQITDWGTYMQTTLITAGEQLKTGLVDGLADCIVKGKSIGDMLMQIGSQILTTIVKGALQKAISQIGIIRSLSASGSTQEIANAQKEAAAQRLKTAILAQNATASLIAAMPFMAFDAGALVAAQMKVAQAAGAIGLARGGLVSGAGTSTSDSIPAMLSDGEYVLNASAVRAIGRSNLDVLNSRVHYAEGGAVGNAPAMAANSPNVTLNVSAMDASSFTDFLRNGAGDIIKQALYDNDRDFTATAGVW